MFLVNSRFPLFSATTTSSTSLSPAVVPLLPKLRGHFAEFLNHSSPDRLSILYLTTCVGYGYGPCTHSLEAFLDSIGSPTSPQRVRITPHPSCTPDLPTGAGHTLTPQSNKWLGYLPVSPHRLATTRSGPTQHHTHNPKDCCTWIWVVSLTDSPLGAHTRVREYQPVIHRLRLSASP